MVTIAEVIATHFADAKKNTRDNTQCALRKLAKHRGLDKGTCDVHVLLESWEPIKEALDTMKVGSRDAYAGYLLSVIKKMQFTCDYREEFTQYMKENGAAAKAKRAQNAPPPVVQENPSLTWRKFVAAEKTLRESEAEYASVDHLVLALHTLIPPARTADVYDKMHVVSVLPPESPEDDNNYCVVTLDDVTLHIRRYKTVRAYGPITITLDESSEYYDVCPELPVLSDIIRAYVSRGKLKSGSKLFPTAAMQLLTNAIERHIGVPDVGNQTVRRLYQEHLLDQGLSRAKQEKLNSLMGHNVDQGSYYDIVREPVETVSVETQTEDCTWHAIVKEAIDLHMEGMDATAWDLLRSLLTVSSNFHANNA